MKYEIEAECNVTIEELLAQDTEIVVTSPYNPSISDLDLPEGAQFVVQNGEYVLINGEKIYI